MAEQVNRPAGILYNHNPELTRDILERDYVVPTVEELRAAKTPKPSKANNWNPQPPAGCGNRWSPVPHHEWIDTIEALAPEFGLSVNNWRLACGTARTERNGLTGHEEQSINNLGHDLAFMADVTGLGTVGDGPDELTRILGGRFSNMQITNARLLAGGLIQICFNGMITGEILIGRKQTSRLDTVDMVRQGLQNWVLEQQSLEQIVDRMKNTTITDRDATVALGRAVGLEGSDPIMSVGFARRTFEEYKNPTHDVFRQNRSWDLYNAATERMKHERGSNDSAQRLQLGLTRILVPAEVSLN